MKSKRLASRHEQATQVVDWTPEGLGLEPGRYEAVMSFLFDRPVPQGQEQEWYWDEELEVFVATSLEWTRFQAAIFANAATDLAAFSDEQVGMTVYDMVKAVDRGMVMENIRVLEKHGGKSGDWVAGS